MFMLRYFSPFPFCVFFIWANKWMGFECYWITHFDYDRDEWVVRFVPNSLELYSQLERRRLMKHEQINRKQNAFRPIIINRSVWVNDFPHPTEISLRIVQPNWIVWDNHNGMKKLTTKITAIWNISEIYLMLIKQNDLIHVYTMLFFSGRATELRVRSFPKPKFHFVIRFVRWLIFHSIINLSVVRIRKQYHCIYYSCLLCMNEWGPFTPSGTTCTTQTACVQHYYSRWLFVYGNICGVQTNTLHLFCVCVYVVAY